MQNDDIAVARAFLGIVAIGFHLALAIGFALVATMLG